MRIKCPCTCILFKHEYTELVTLTTQPNKLCGQYHKRMPALVLARDKDDWFNASPQELSPMLKAIEDRVINIEQVD